MTTSTDDLFLQVRTAHRLLAAYYQRLHPKLDALATQADATFDFWTPQLFEKPARANPFKKWQWDLLPAAVTRYVFKRVADTSKVTQGDYTLELIVINDTGIVKEKGKGQPDALKLPQDVESAQSLLRVGIYRACEESSKDYYAEWNSLAYPSYADSDAYQRDKGFVTIGFEVPIAQLMTEEGFNAANEKIAEYLTLTEQAAFSHTKECEA